MAKQESASEGIEFKPNGTIVLTIDGVVRKLRRPKLREYRYWSEQLRDLAKSAQAEAARLQELLGELTEESDPAEVERIEKELEEANQRRIEYTTPWTAGVVEQFSENPLDEDPNEWPSWLALDLSIPSKILGHWKASPLVPGAAGTN